MLEQERITHTIKHGSRSRHWSWSIIHPLGMPAKTECKISYLKGQVKHVTEYYTV